MFEKFKNKKILILGFGVEGQNTLKLIRKELKDKNLAIADSADLNSMSKKVQSIIKNDKNIKLFLGKKYLSAIEKYSVIIKSPGISKFIPEVSKASKNGILITSQTQIFFDNAEKEKIIGITGTKGKSTTASLIYKIIKNAGKNVTLIGNIGIPPLGALKNKKYDYYVFEISSYQLENIEKAPHISVFLNIFKEHLDYHKNFKNYLKAKKNIFLNQSSNDLLVINNDFLNLLPKNKKSNILTFGFKNIKKGCYIKNQNIVFKNNSAEEIIMKESQVPLMGKANILNIMAAICTTKLLGIENKIIEKSIEEYKQLPHRIEKIGNFKEITFYDDSISTVPEASIAAMEALGDNVGTIIMGGHDRKISFDILSKHFKTSKIKNIILFPPSGKRIWQAISKNNKKINYYFVNDMKTAVKIAFEKTNKQKICLLSPASPSYGLFKDYKDRGAQFRKEIKIYKNN